MFIVCNHIPYIEVQVMIIYPFSGAVLRLDGLYAPEDGLVLSGDALQLHLALHVVQTAVAHNKHTAGFICHKPQSSHPEDLYAIILQAWLYNYIIPFLGFPVALVFNPASGVHDVVHAREEFVVVPLDGHHSVFLFLRRNMIVL